MEHVDALRRWLREKGYHPADIAVAIEFYNRNEPKPKDSAVLAVAEESHKFSVDMIRSPLTMDIHLITSLKGSLLGAGTAVIIVEILKWGLEQIALAW